MNYSAVEYHENLYDIQPTGAENYLLFYFGSPKGVEMSTAKASLFDLNTRKFVKDFYYDDEKAAGYRGICNGNYFPFEKNYEETRIIDLTTLETAHIFNAKELLYKHILSKKYRTPEYKIEALCMINVGITEEIIIQLFDYEIHGAQSGELIGEKRTFLAFDPVTFEYAGRCPYSLYKKISDSIYRPNTVYNSKKLEVALSSLNVERRPVAQAGQASYCDKILHFTTGGGEHIEKKLLYPKFFNKKYNLFVVQVYYQAVLFYFDKDYDIDKAFEEAEEKAKQAEKTAVPKIKRYDAGLPDEEIFKSEDFDAVAFIRERGITESALKNFSDAEIFDGGYLFATDIIKKKESESGLKDVQLLGSSQISEEIFVLYGIGLFDEMTNGDGLDEYLLEYEEYTDSLLKALNIVGATKTVNLLNKALSVKEKWLDIDMEKMTERLDAICGEILDCEKSDYVEKTVAYVKKLKGYKV